MGIGDLFRRRRERESAIPSSATELSAAAGADAEAGSDSGYGGGPIEADPRFADQVGDPTSGRVLLPGADPLELGQMIAQAIQSGSAQVSTESHVIDMRGSGLREEITGMLSSPGIDVEEGGGREIDAGSVTGLQEQVLEALQRHGVDVENPTDPGNDD